jgi:hypothetical protein
MFFIAWFKYTLHTENVYTNIMNQKSASFLTIVTIRGACQSLYKYRVLPHQSKPRAMADEECKGRLVNTQADGMCFGLTYNLLFHQMQHIKCMKTSTKIEKLYKSAANCMWSATPCVRPVWWEDRSGYVQHTHQAHTQTCMSKPSGHRVDRINKKETVLIIVHHPVSFLT